MRIISSRLPGGTLLGLLALGVLSPGLGTLSAMATVRAQSTSLTAVLRMIAAQSPRVLAARAAAQEARAHVGIARAARFGTVYVYARSQHYNDPRLIRPITLPPNVKEYSFAGNQLGYGIEAQLPLDFSLRIAAGVAGARAGARTAGWDAQNTRLRAILDGAILYRDLQSLLGKRNALVQQINALQYSEQVARSGLRTGLDSRLKLLRVEAGLQEARAVLAGVSGRMQGLRAQLAALMGLPGFTALIQPIVAPPNTPPVATARPVPAIEAAHSSLAGSEARLRAAWRDLLPQFYIAAGWNRNTVQSFHAGVQTWQVSLGMRLNLWSGGAQTSRIKAARAAAEAARQRLLAARYRLRSARWSARAAWQAQAETYRAALAGLQAARESARIEQNNFRVGLSSATDLLDVEATLARARARVAATLAAWWQADDRLRYAYGEPPLALTSAAIPTHVWREENPL